MPTTRAYEIKVTDVAAKREVLFTVVDWDDAEKRVALAQIMRWAGVPSEEGGCFLDEVAPEPRPRKS